jgi:hypothetical protein
LATLIRPFITLAGVKGKKKVPAFHSRTINRKEETRTILKHKEGNQRELHIRSLDDYTIDTDAKTFEIVFRLPPFVPVKVFKSLLKIGLSLLPTEFDEFNRQSFAWLTNRQSEIAFIQYAFTCTLKRSQFTEPSADLYRAKNFVLGEEEYPEHILIVCFANQVFQIFLPFSDELKEVNNEKRQLALCLFPSYVYNKILGPQTMEIKYFNLGVEAPITGDSKLSFSYEDAEINIPKKQ